MPNIIVVCCLFRVAKTTIMDVYQQAGFTQSKKYPFHIGSPVVRTGVQSRDYQNFSEAERKGDCHRKHA